MGLHDRLKSTNGSGGAPSDERPVALAGQPREQSADRSAVDPYAELKTRLHHACIAKLGPELFQRESSGTLAEQVLRTVSEQLALDRTPLTRDERRQLVKEIADDILGYGPLEPLLADDSVTEVMVNAYDRVYIERRGKLELSDVNFADNEHVLRIVDKIVSQVGRRIDES